MYGYESFWSHGIYSTYMPRHFDVPMGTRLSRPPRRSHALSGVAPMSGASLFPGVPYLSRVGYVSCYPPRHGLYLCLRTLNDDDLSRSALNLSLPSIGYGPTHDPIFFTLSNAFWSWVFHIDTILVGIFTPSFHSF